MPGGSAALQRLFTHQGISPSEQHFWVGFSAFSGQISINTDKMFT